MKNINFGNGFLTILVGVILVFGLYTDISAQTRRKKTTTKKTTTKKTPVRTPTTKSNLQTTKSTNDRGAGDDDENTNSTSGTTITVGNSNTNDAYQNLKFETPFLDRCPKQKSGAEKVICVGIGGGSDEATPEEIDEIHKTVSRIFYGKRFVMVRLSGLTLPNQQDEAKSKGCDFFVQTLYKSPFLKGEGTSVWEKVAGMTISQLPKTITDLKVVSGDKTVNATNTGKATESVMGSTGEFFKKMNIFKKSKKFEVTFNFFRPDDISKPFVSFQQEAKIDKNPSPESVANSLYNLMRESTENMQLIFLNPEGAQKVIEDFNSKKKERNKKNKN